jgi:hypothetical protein
MLLDAVIIAVKFLGRRICAFLSDFLHINRLVAACDTTSIAASTPIVESSHCRFRQHKLQQTNDARRIYFKDLITVINTTPNYDELLSGHLKCHDTEGTKPP